MPVLLAAAPRREPPPTAPARVQEVGWHSKPLSGGSSAVSKELFFAPRGSCDVTTYASAYYAMTGTTPFSRVAGSGDAAPK